MAQQITRTFRASFAVLNRLRSTISINTTPVKVVGLINNTTLQKLERTIAQEWYLHHMGDEKYVDPETTTKTNPLDDFQVTITGMVPLECDEEGNLAEWIKR